MRIQPVYNSLNYNHRISNKAQTQFESNSNSINLTKTPHLYTGIASVDLAYASLLDGSIAKDLRSMGLI